MCIQYIFKKVWVSKVAKKKKKTLNVLIRLYMPQTSSKHMCGNSIIPPLEALIKWTTIHIKAMFGL